jgi:hypothetical protein
MLGTSALAMTSSSTPLAHRRQHADTCDSGCAHDSNSHLKRRPGLNGQTGAGAEVVI